MNDQPLMINSALIVGGGSAGFLVALSLAKKVPWLKLQLLRSPDIGIIGVGEGTTASVTHHLHDYLDIDPGEFFAQAKPQWKLGLRMLWGNRPYFDYTFNNQLETHYALLDRATAQPVAAQRGAHRVPPNSDSSAATTASGSTMRPIAS